LRTTISPSDSSIAVGGVISLGDRDCSLQRRNQKVVEEAPAFDLPEELRERLHAVSRELCASINYRSAGTVEFVYDSERKEASFLEVNTTHRRRRTTQPGSTCVQ